MTSGWISREGTRTFLALQEHPGEVSIDQSFQVKLAGTLLDAVCTADRHVCASQLLNVAFHLKMNLPTWRP